MAISEGGQVETLLQEAFDHSTEMIGNLLETAAEWQASDHSIDLSGLATMIRELGENARRATTEFRLQEFMDTVRNEGVAAVAAWKERHGEQVEMAYDPSVPDSEVDATVEAHGIITERIQERREEVAAQGGILRSFREGRLSHKQSQADEALGAAESTRGTKHLAQIRILWAAMDRLASIEASVGVSDANAQESSRTPEENPQTGAGTPSPPSGEGKPQMAEENPAEKVGS